GKPQPSVAEMVPPEMFSVPPSTTTAVSKSGTVTAAPLTILSVSPTPTTMGPTTGPSIVPDVARAGAAAPRPSRSMSAPRAGARHLQEGMGAHAGPPCGRLLVSIGVLLRCGCAAAGSKGCRRQGG